MQLKETCLQSRPVCTPFDSQVQPSFALWGATDRQKTLQKAYKDAVEQQGKNRRSANCLHRQEIPTCHQRVQSECKKDGVRLGSLFYLTTNITSNSASYQELCEKLAGFLLVALRRDRRKFHLLFFSHVRVTCATYHGITEWLGLERALKII